MTAPVFRYDYLKWCFDLAWGGFRPLWNVIQAVAKAELRDCDLEKNNKVFAAPPMDKEGERTFAQVWGQVSGVLEFLGAEEYIMPLKRVDIRAILWDASEDAVLALGQAIQRHETAYNVEVFNSKKASKREGRDRGGKGFRIGSRKSDLCIVVYKRSQEQTCIEYRFQGQMLAEVLRQVKEQSEASGTWEHAPLILSQKLEVIGNHRFSNVMERAGHGTYWPIKRQGDEEVFDALQRSFAVPLDSDGIDQEYLDWCNSIDDANRPVEEQTALW